METAKIDVDRAFDLYWYNYRDQERSALLHELNVSQRNTRVSWRLIPKARLKRIWSDFGKCGVVRDSKGVSDIMDIVIRNVARISVITWLMGHTQHDARAELAEEDSVTFSDETWEDHMPEFFTDVRGNWLISDGALPNLENLVVNLIQAESDEERVYVIDRILNVVHRRSDLASWFVEGGCDALTELQMQ